MPKTARVDYLLQHFGELDDAELAEAREISMGRPMDYVPIIPGTDAEPVREPEYAPKTPRSLEFDLDPVSAMAKDAGPMSIRPGSRLEGLAALEERLMHAEGMIKHLWDKIAVLEARSGVGKDPT